MGKLLSFLPIALPSKSKWTTGFQIALAAVNDARACAAAAEKEVRDLEELLTKPGTMRAVKLIHDAEGRAVGAVITDRL